MALVRMDASVVKQVANFEFADVFSVSGDVDEVVTVYVHIDEGFLVHTGAFWSQPTETKLKRLNGNITIGGSGHATVSSFIVTPTKLPARIMVTAVNSVPETSQVSFIIYPASYPSI